MAENTNAQDKSNDELNINPDRSPFTKLDNKRQNLHSQDVDREEIAEGNPSLDQKQTEDFQKEPWRKNKQ